MWDTQVPGIPSFEREVGGQGHHLVQAATKKFGTNKRMLMEVIQGYKYRVSTKVPFAPTKTEEGEEAPTTSETAPTSDPTTT